MKPSISNLVLFLALAASMSIFALEPNPGLESKEATDTNAAPAAIESVTNAPAARVIQPAQLNLPPELSEVVRLAESGVSDDAILTFIQKSPPSQPLTADQILYLRDLGISSPILTALIENRPPAEAPPMQAQTEPAPSEPVPAPNVPQYPPAEEPATPAAPVEADVNYFYGSLSPYGSWLDLPGYGWCWQPTVAVVSPGWRPYCDAGWWAWSDCGWYWNSYYSWGWAPFHYGRWCQYPRYGWLWFPGRTWAPAWVSWRHSGDHCGWAPLPPGSHYSAAAGWTHHGRRVSDHYGFGIPASSYTFVGINHLTDRHLSSHALRGSEADSVFHRTQVNNSFAEGANHRIINRGVDPQRVQTATRQPVRTTPVAALERAHRNSAPPTVSGRSVGPSSWSSVRSSRSGQAPGMSAPPATRSAPAQGVPTYRPQPAVTVPQYRAQPTPQYRSQPAPQFRSQPAPAPAYRSQPSPTFRSQPTPQFRTAPSTQFRSQPSIQRSTPAYSRSQPQFSAPRSSGSAPQSRPSYTRPQGMNPMGAQRR